jgi:UPF0271 protein
LCVVRVDINCDMGESFGAYRIGDDEAVMRSISSANVAAGFHGGDPSVIRRTVRLAREAGVAVGAHPGFPDLIGFGRRDLDADPRDVEDMVLYQVAAVAGIAAAEGVTLRHVKPHGALYTMAARDRRLADAIARAVRAAGPQLIVFSLPGSALMTASREAGLQVASEVFADRAYEADGSLASRRASGAVIHDPARVVERALRMIREGVVVALNGKEVPIEADTICVHGDTPGAATLTARLRDGLQAAGVRILPVGSPNGER